MEAMFDPLPELAAQIAGHATRVCAADGLWRDVKGDGAIDGKPIAYSARVKRTADEVVVDGVVVTP